VLVLFTRARNSKPELEQLLTTKLYIPPSRPDLVHRSRLVELLNHGLHRKLTLISAPAGFGKTTLISEWVNQANMPVAWLSLDEGDNDPTRFLSYFASALNTIDRDIGETALSMLSSPQPPSKESVLTAIINGIASFNHHFLLVLDDYHVIESQAIHDALGFLLDHLPTQMHLVITSRSDPLLPIPRLRAKGQLAELRADNLRFTTLEATKFLNQVMGLALSEDQVLSLDTRTEGWIAGLHLAALSMQNKEDVEKFISEFAGDDRYIVDYLVDEVLAQRPEGTRDFLLQTSILDRMAGSLCNAVTAQSGGQEMLEKLEQANVFIVPLDNRRQWYRYHHLFVDLLRQRLTEVVDSHTITILHQRASHWYEENNFLVEAVEHALAAQDFDNVIRLVELGSMEILMRGQQSLLLKWQAELPRELVASHPNFCMTVAWAWLSTGHPDEAEACLQFLEHSLGIKMVEMFSEQDRAENLNPSVQSILVEITVMRIELASQEGDIPQVFKLSQQVLPYLEDKEGSPRNKYLEDLRSVVFFVMGLAYKKSGKLGEAAEALSKAAELGQGLGNVYIAAGSLGRLAGVQSMQGHLNQAVRTCQRGLKLVEEMVGEPPMYGLIHAELGNLLYEQNNLDTAFYHFQKGIELAKPWGFLEAFVPGYTGLARVKAAKGDWDGAFYALDELAALGESNPTMVTPAVESMRALLWVTLGKVEAANRWGLNAVLDPEGEIDFQRLSEWIVYARVLLARHASHEAVNLLVRLGDAAEAGGWFRRLIELRILLALAHQMGGDRDQAMIALEQALRSAEPEGYVRIFLDEGEPMEALLREAENKGLETDYLYKLLAAFETELIQVETSPAPPLIEPLSERELEVLRLLKTELSGPDIATELMIALSTLRTHTQNIYSKLGVSNRRAAVRKAEELNLR